MPVRIETSTLALNQEDATKERLEEPLQTTHEELVAKASQEAGFSKKIGLGHFFRTRPQCNDHGRCIVAARKADMYH